MAEKETNIIPIALEYYDRMQEKYLPLLSKVKRHELVLSPYDMERNKIKLFDEDGKELLTSEYEVIGLYHNVFKIWRWAWSIPILKKNAIYISRSILNYGLDLDKADFLKSELITSRFSISDNIQLDMHISIATYLAKKVPYSYKFYPDETNRKNYVTYYIFLLNADK